MRQKLTSKQMKAKFIQNVSSESMKIKDEKRGISQLIRLCEKKDLLPCVVFVFSRRKINELSMGLAEMKSIKLIDKVKLAIYVENRRQDSYFLSSRLAKAETSRQEVAPTTSSAGTAPLWNSHPSWSSLANREGSG